jgi:hypothetical protein
MDWYYMEMGERQGPFTDEDMEKLEADGTIGPDTRVWNPAIGADWVRLGDLGGSEPEQSGAGVSLSTAVSRTGAVPEGDSVAAKLMRDRDEARRRQRRKFRLPRWATTMITLGVVGLLAYSCVMGIANYQSSSAENYSPLVQLRLGVLHTLDEMGTPMKTEFKGSIGNAGDRLVRRVEVKLELQPGGVRNYSFGPIQPNSNFRICEQLGILPIMTRYKVTKTKVVMGKK